MPPPQSIHVLGSNCIKLSAAPIGLQIFYYIDRSSSTASTFLSCLSFSSCQKVVTGG